MKVKFRSDAVPWAHLIQRFGFLKAALEMTGLLSKLEKALTKFTPFYCSSKMLYDAMPFKNLLFILTPAVFRFPAAKKDQDFGGWASLLDNKRLKAETSVWPGGLETCWHFAVGLGSVSRQKMWQQLCNVVSQALKAPKYVIADFSWWLDHNFAILGKLKVSHSM